MLLQILSQVLFLLPSSLGRLAPGQLKRGALNEPPETPITFFLHLMAKKTMSQLYSVTSPSQVRCHLPLLKPLSSDLGSQNEIKFCMVR